MGGTVLVGATVLVAVTALAIGALVGGDVIHAADEGGAVPDTPAGGVPLGVYVGAGNPRGVARFAAATGARPSLASDYLPGDGGWSGMVTRGPLGRILTPWRGSGYRLVLGVPLIPEVDRRPVASLARGATGRYDAEFATLARTLVSYGQGDAVVRLGWEFNADWYPWRVTDAADAADYAGYFRHVVTAMRRVPGTSFVFVWNPTPGPSAVDPAEAWPGDRYVDIVGLDVYDQVWGMPQDPSLVWSHLLTEDTGLHWLSTFAAAHHAAVSLPEWGVTVRSDGHGLGDDPLFVSLTAQWIATHDAAFSSYFDFNASDGEHDILDGHFPNALAAFERSFAASSPVPVRTAGPLPGGR